MAKRTPDNCKYIRCCGEPVRFRPTRTNFSISGKPEGRRNMRLIDADKVDFNEVIVGASDFARDTRAAAQSLIDGQPEISRWIPVAERTPEAELQSSIKERGEYAVVPVLVSAQKRDAEGKAYIVTDRAFYFERFGVKNFHNYKAEPMKVLAWMPLPEPYKPEN